MSSPTYTCTYMKDKFLTAHFLFRSVHKPVHNAPRCIIFHLSLPYFLSSPIPSYVCASLTVTVASSPSGTLATMIPIRKRTASSQAYCSAIPMAKKLTPRITATAVIRWMKWEISTDIGVSVEGRTCTSQAKYSYTGTHMRQKGTRNG